MIEQKIRTFEVYCEKFSQIIQAETIRGAIDLFLYDNRGEKIILIIEDVSYRESGDKAEDGWISVEDRLPEAIEGWDFSCDVLSFDVESGMISIDSYWPCHKSWESDNKNITHWQPLPSPPNTQVT